MKPERRASIFENNMRIRRYQRASWQPNARWNRKAFPSHIHWSSPPGSSTIETASKQRQLPEFDNPLRGVHHEFPSTASLLLSLKLEPQIAWRIIRQSRRNSFTSRIAQHFLECIRNVLSCPQEPQSLSPLESASQVCRSRCARFLRRCQRKLGSLSLKADRLKTFARSCRL